MKHEMKLNDDAFKVVKAGTKTIELRLNDEKRRLINVGDIIEFENNTTLEKIDVLVTHLHKYENFEELYKHFDKVAMGYRDDEAADPNDMDLYYPKEIQEKYGVLGIEIMSVKIIDNIASDDLIVLRESVSWKKINHEQIKKALNHTMIKISVKNNDKIVACGRLVGDYSCKGVLSDIIVCPDYQGMGLGKIVVKRLLEIVNNSLKPGQLFQIEATPTSGNRDFYIKCGFKYKPEIQDGVYIWLKK